MKFCEKLYWGEKAEKEQKKLIKALKRKKNFVPSMYVITPASNGENLLDVLDAFSLLNPVTEYKNLLVVGVALGKDEALELVRLIVDETYRELGTVDIKKYLGLG